MLCYVLPVGTFTQHPTLVHSAGVYLTDTPTRSDAGGLERQAEVNHAGDRLKASIYEHYPAPYLAR